MYPAPQDKQAVLEEDPLEEMMDVASATECTGLMPTPPANEAEAELSPFPGRRNRPKNTTGNGRFSPENSPGRVHLVYGFDDKPRKEDFCNDSSFVHGDSLLQ